MDKLGTQQATLITLVNEKDDQETSNDIILVVKSTDGEYMRYLVSVPPNDISEFHLVGLEKSVSIEAYSSFPFRLYHSNTFSNEGGETLVSDATVTINKPSRTEPTSNALNCFGTNPNSNIRIKVTNSYTQSSVDSWFAASWYNGGIRLYQNIDVFWPNEFDLYHERDKVTDNNSECNGFAPNNTKSYTKAVHDSRKVHYWEDLALVYNNFQTKDVLCYGSRTGSSCWSGNRQGKYTYKRR